MLTLADFPSGFVEIPEDELGLEEQDLGGGEFTFESMSVFVEYEHFEVVMCLTVLLLNRFEQVGFDLALNQPEFLMAGVAGGMGPAEIIEQGEPVQLDDVGDAAAGMTLVADASGVPMRMDLIVFRRGIAGIFAAVMYIDGDVPVVTVDEVATTVDERLVDTLQPGG
jgi:hypothetical protein